MGVAQAMENLAEEVRSATAARNEFFTNFRQDSKKHGKELRRQMNDLHNENRNKARELRGNLTSGERSRQNAARQDTDQCRVAVSESRSNTHSLLNRFQLEHKEKAGALQEKLSAEEKGRIEATRQARNDIRRAVNDIRRATRSLLGEFAADLRGAHEAWAGVKKK